MVFIMSPKIERELISSRTKEALRAKKAHGIKLERPKGTGKSKLDKFKPEIEGLLKFQFKNLLLIGIILQKLVSITGV